MRDAEALDAAVVAVQPGDEIVILEGRYDWPMRIEGADGTAERPITLRAETLGEVVFTGGDLTGGAKLDLRASHWVIDGWSFEGVTRSGEASRDRVTVVRVRGGSDNVLRNLSITGCGLTADRPDERAANNSLYVQLTDGALRNVIERSRLADNRHCLGIRIGGGADNTDVTGNVIRRNLITAMAGYETLQLSWGSAAEARFETLVEENLWQDNAGCSELISSKSSANTFRGNTFRRCDDQLVLRSGRDSVVEGNWFEDSWGVRAYGAGHRITGNAFLGSFGEAKGNRRGAILLGSGAEGGRPYEAFTDGWVTGNLLVDDGEVALVVGYNHGLRWEGRVMDVPPTGSDFVDNLTVGSVGLLVQRAPGEANRWRENAVMPFDRAEAGEVPGPNAQVHPFAGPFEGLRREALLWWGRRMRPLEVGDVGPGSGKGGGG